MKKHSTLLCSCLIAAVYGLSQTDAEKALTQKANTFITTQKAEWLLLEQAVTQMPDNTPDAKQKAFYQKQPFYQAYQTFLHENGAAYAAARKAQLLQYAPPPEGLQQLTWQQPEWYAGESEAVGMDMIALAFLRSYNPVEITQLAWNLVTPSFFAATNTPLTEAQNLYHLRDLYGTRLYTKPLNDSVWQLWSADRSMAVTFRCDIRNAVITAVRYSLPGDPAFAAIVWPPSVIQPADSTTRLSAVLWEALWKNYPGSTYQPEAYAQNLMQRNQVLNSFTHEHLPEIMSIRKQLLQQLPATRPALSGYKPHPLETAQLLQHADTALYAACFMQPQHWAAVIAASAAYLHEADPKTIAMLIQRNAIFPTTCYAKQINNEEWEVLVNRETDAISYTWNINTGHIARIIYLTKPQK